MRGTKKSKIFLSSPEEMVAFGKEFGKTLREGAVVVFEGDLAAGKTTLIKGIVAGAAEYPIDRVSSPTFVYLQIYEGNKTVYHFDLYRLTSPDEFQAMGFDEVFSSGGITLIEWPEKIPGMVPDYATKIAISHSSCGGRELIIDESIQES